MRANVNIRKAVIAMLTSASLAACSESGIESTIQTTTDEVAFNVAVKQVDTVSVSLAQTRSATNGMGLPVESFEMSNDENTIYANQLAIGLIDAHNNVASSKTRGTEINTSNFYSSFGLYGYFYGESESWNSSMPPSIVEEVTQSSGWKASKAWPGGSKGAFFAWAPYSTDNLTVSSSSTPSITYTVPAVISSQQDILVCKTAELSSSKTPIALDFKHALTAVKFVVGNIGYFTEIKSIKIEGVYNKGTLEIGGSEWKSLSGSASYEITGSYNISTVGTGNMVGELMFLMPQTLPTGAKLSVVMANGVKEQTFTANLAASKWPMGNTVTYKLSVRKIEGEYKFEVTPRATSFNHNGGNMDYSVMSYYKYTDDNTVNVPWTASFSTNGGSTWSSTAPSWLTGFTTTGIGGTSASSYTATVSAQSSSSGNDVTATSVLKNAAVVSDYDLSTHTVSGASCSMTTANCYLVHAAGTYKLPLVYGNAIKNGATNTTAYSPTGTNGDTFLTPFLNHDGYGITDPWLKNNNATPDGAMLIWQDVNGLITNVGISGDYLTFTTASQSDIAEGNAVIAATKDGVVVWSWHIWVTPETLSTLATIGDQSIIYKVTPVNLGWVNIGNISWTGYEGRSCTVKITQSGGQEETFVVTQNPSRTVTASKQGVNTYYQWGRKDPEIPAARINSTTDNHAAYNISGSSVIPTSLQTSVVIGTTIQNPLIHYYNSSNLGPYSTSQYNLWDANNTATGQIKTNTVKTIYDPCPAGFCIPTSYLWYLMINGDKSTYGSWDSTNYGRLWEISEPDVYFPASGYRGSNDCSLKNVSSLGCYWSASPHNSNYGRFLKLDSIYFYWDHGERAVGCPVRAVLEE